MSVSLHRRLLHTIAIRREAKNRWERRTPLTPSAVKQLLSDLSPQKLRVIVQPSAKRIFPDDAYAAVFKTILCGYAMI